jgi:bis(5'-nucleosyl)-tetraphosphatase (symmetrical)
VPTYVIGDVQGCFDTFERLLHAVDYEPAKDRVWLVGDLVNRGPKSVDVLRWAQRHERSTIAVLGNHDLHLLARAFGISERKKRDTLEDVLSAPDRDDLIEWLLHRPFLHRQGPYTLVHAGLLPQWTVEDAEALAQEAQSRLQKEPVAFLRRLTQRREDPGDPIEHAVAVLTRLRTCTAAGQMDNTFNGPPHEAPKGYGAWFALATRRSRGQRILFGHWAALGLSLGPDWSGLDTGCVWGEKLTALRLDDEAVFQQRNVDPLPHLAIAEKA